ncbi:reverse transcriptase domain-containing protein [Tanacetum coccineum]
MNRRRKYARNLVRSYGTCFSERQRDIEREWDATDREDHRKFDQNVERYLSKSENDGGGHWKSKSKKPKSTTDEEDVSQPWLYEEVDPFTLQIRNFEFPKQIRMPSNVKMLWFDDLPPESIDSYIKLRKAFLKNFLHQKKYIKDPVEIHHIKQREEELTEAFMGRFKAESMHIKGALECMRVSGFMHGITNPDLIKRLNENIPKLVDEMMSITTAFLRGEVAMVNQSRKKGPSS